MNNVCTGFVCVCKCCVRGCVFVGAFCVYVFVSDVRMLGGLCCVHVFVPDVCLYACNEQN